MKRQLKEAFPLIPAGEQVVCISKIDDADYAKFGKLVVTVEDAKGASARVNFNFEDDDGSTNEIAEGIYTRMCRAAMNDQTLDECDTNDLLGKFVLVEVIHKEGSKGGTFANVKKWIGPAEPFRRSAGAQTTRPTQSAKPAAGGAAAPRGKKTAAEILAELRAKKAAGGA